MKTTNKNNNVAIINNNTQKNMEEITMKNNNQNVTVNNTTSKEETTMTNQNNAAANNMIIAMSKEEVTMKTKDEIRTMLEVVGVKMSNNEFKRTKKADLVTQLEKYLDPTKKVEIVEAPVTETVTEEKKEENVMTDKMKQYLDSKWDKLVKAVAKEYVDQSINTKFALFYKNTKATATNGEYLVKSSRLWGATSKAIKSLYGEKHCDEKAIRETLNAMVVRGYLNYQKVQGEKGVNVIFNATAAQMNAMWKLSR